ncbi:hypothetical protein GKC32_01265 [Lactobacillus curvatus]|nr:hypothetical protein [Latilactobacillus curvatus]MSE23103.1 hypothetical protein [Latilactobacillus curvatus]
MSKKSNAAKQAKIDRLSAAISKLQHNKEQLAGLSLNKLVNAGSNQWAGTCHNKFISDLSNVQRELINVNVGIDKAIADYRRKVNELNSEIYSDAYSSLAKYELNSHH